MTGVERSRSLDELYDEAFSHMEWTVDELAKRVPPPQFVERSGGMVFRYEERLPLQAVVLKLARLVSTLRATHLLLDRGFVQEVGTLERVMDEFQQDVLFLVSGHTDRTLAIQYQRYLEEFWKEEFDADTAFASSQKRGMPRRQKIRAHIGRMVSEITGSTANAGQTAEQFRTVDKAQSGYVHGAAPQLMEMFGGSPPRFHMDGMLGSPTEQVHREQFWYYVSRSICAFALAVQAFGDDDGFAKIRAYAVEFDRSRPDNGRGRADPLFA